MAKNKGDVEGGKKRGVFYEKMEKLFDVLGEAVAFFTVAIYVVWILNLNFSFIPANSALSLIINGIKLYATLILLIIVGFEATIKRPLLIRIIFYLMVAVVLVFSFFPDVWASLTTSL